MLVGQNALYFEDYLLSIQYFNQVIKAKPYLAEPYFYRAYAKFCLDDFKGAEEDCTRCIERNPFYAKAYQLRADSRQNQKKYDGALEDYAVSLKDNPKEKSILINLGIVNIEKKNFDEAERYLDELVSIYPNYTYGILTRGTLYLEKADTLKALNDYNEAIQKDKYFSPAYSMRSSVYLAQKNYEKAVMDLDEAIKLDPLLTGNFINRGLARYYQNDLRGAMSDYNHVIELDKTNLIAHFNRALLRSQVGDDNNAISDFNFVIQNEPDNFIAYMNRGMLKNNIGDVKGALSDIDKVLTEYPDFYQGFYLRSEIKRKHSNLKGAEQDYLYARRIEDQTRKDILSGKRKEKEKTREKSDKTIDKFNLLVVADKEDPEKDKYNSETRGRIQNKQANVDLELPFVISYYEEESELDGTLNYNKALEDLNKKGQLSRKLIVSNREIPLDSIQVEIHFSSINEYSKLIVESPEDALYYFGRGLDYMLVQDFASAIEDFTKATLIDPNFSLAFFNLAAATAKQIKTRESLPELYRQTDTQTELVLNMQLGGDRTVTSGLSTLSQADAKSLRSKLEYESVLKNYGNVLNLVPDFSYAYYNRAGIKSEQNDFRAAILDYNEAIKLNPDFSQAYYNRGLCRLKIKDTDRGLDDLRKAGELGIVNAYGIIKRMTR